MTRRERFIRELVRLCDANLSPVLLCRAGERGTCSAPWHRICTRAGKRPLVTGYSRYALAPPNIDDLVALTSRIWPVNVGIVTGNRVVVVEADSPEADAEILGLGAVALKTPIRQARPGRGRAWLFRLPGDQLLANRAHLGNSGAIDVRAAGGVLVVPPSHHVTGHRYRWELPPWGHELAMIPAPLLALVRKVPIPRASRRSRSEGLSPAVSSHVRSLLEAHLVLTRLWRGEDKQGADLSASGYDFSLALHLLRLRVPPGEVAAAVAARPGAHRHDIAYADLTVANAARLLSTKRGSTQ